MSAERPTPRGGDRRARPTRAFSRHALRGRRRELRRVTDRVRGGYVDRPRTSDVALVVAVVLLSFADAVFTLDHVARGGVEWNPVMRALLDVGVAPFVAGKMAVTTLGMVFLLAHMHFHRTRSLARFVLGAYIVLTVYHVTLLDVGAAPGASTTQRLLTTLEGVVTSLLDAPLG